MLGDMVIRRWRPDDLDAKFAALSASFDHLHRWMPWAAEPPDLDTLRVEHDRQVAHWPTPDGGFTYGIFDGTGAVLGAVGLHDRVGPATLEIGYWCHVDHLGRGIITRAAGSFDHRRRFAARHHPSRNPVRRRQPAQCGGAAPSGLPVGEHRPA